MNLNELRKLAGLPLLESDPYDKERAQLNPAFNKILKEITNNVARAQNLIGEPPSISGLWKYINENIGFYNQIRGRIYSIDKKFDPLVKHLKELENFTHKTGRYAESVSESADTKVSIEAVYNMLMSSTFERWYLKEFENHVEGDDEGKDKDGILADLKSMLVSR